MAIVVDTTVDSSSLSLLHLGMVTMCLCLVAVEFRLTLDWQIKPLE